MVDGVEIERVLNGERGKFFSSREIHERLGKRNSLQNIQFHLKKLARWKRVICKKGNGRAILVRARLRK